MKLSGVAVGRGRGPELGGGQIEFVCLGIDRHGAGATLGRDGLGHFVLAGALVHDGQRAFAVGAEGESRAGVEARAVGALPDRESSDDFASIGIGDGHDLVGGVRDVDAAGGAVDGEIVPATFTADVDLASHVIPGRRRKRGGGQEERQRNTRRWERDGRQGWISARRALTDASKGGISWRTISTRISGATRS
jgi:hypothetical protein